MALRCLAPTLNRIGDDIEIFISYRRLDNNLLAGVVANRIREKIPSAGVFFDQESIGGGRDYRSVIDTELARCAVAVALIGPAWDDGGRLHDEADFVRYELVRARALGKGVIPVLHSNRSMPLARTLPDDLAWVATLQAVHLGLSYDELKRGVDRLCATIVGFEPELRELRNRVWASYEEKRDDDALAEAEEAWNRHSEQPSPALADCCRAAALVLTRQGRIVERNLWLARAISTGALGGGRNSIAASLLPFFFQLSNDGFHDQARSVLTEIARLTEDDPTQSPPPHMMRRLYSEKLAWSLSESGDLDAAIEEYDRAIEVSGDDLRGTTKARGGQANCRFRAGDVTTAVVTTEDVLALCRAHGWVDLGDVAEANLHVMRGGDGELQPYEVT